MRKLSKKDVKDLAREMFRVFIDCVTKYVTDKFPSEGKTEKERLHSVAKRLLLNVRQRGLWRYRIFPEEATTWIQCLDSKQGVIPPDKISLTYPTDFLSEEEIEKTKLLKVILTVLWALDGIPEGILHYDDICGTNVSWSRILLEGYDVVDSFLKERGLTTEETNLVFKEFLFYVKKGLFAAYAGEEG